MVTLVLDNPLKLPVKSVTYNFYFQGKARERIDLVNGLKSLDIALIEI